MSKPSGQRPATICAPGTDGFDGFQAPREHARSRSRWITTRLALKSGWAIDFILIVAMAPLADITYQLLNNGGAAVLMSTVGIGILVAANFLAVLAATKRQGPGGLRHQSEQLRDCLKIWLVVFAALAMLGFTMKISADFSRGATILFFAFGATALAARRLVFAHYLERALANGWFLDRSVFVLAESGQTSLAHSLHELRLYGLRPVRIYEFARITSSAQATSASLRDALSQLIGEAQEYAIEDVYVCINWQHRQIIESILQALSILPMSVHLLFDDNASRLLSNPTSNVGQTRTVELARQPLSRGEQFSKRILDVLLASIALLLLCPLMAVTAILIKIDSRGPIFFLQRRNGFNGINFNIFKYRTMSVMENGATVQQTKRNDPRVTRLGRWLRKSSIDELPQLLNVLKGEMSLVGPRPHAAAHNTEYGARIVNYAFRHHVKPGITGWAQVKGYRGETQTIDLMERRVEHDIWYINNWSLALDCRILVMTMLISFRQSSAY